MEIDRCQGGETFHFIVGNLKLVTLKRKNVMVMYKIVVFSLKLLVL